MSTNAPGPSDDGSPSPTSAEAPSAEEMEIFSSEVERAAMQIMKFGRATMDGELFVAAITQVCGDLLTSMTADVVSGEEPQARELAQSWAQRLFGISSEAMGAVQLAPSWCGFCAGRLKPLLNLMAPAAHCTACNHQWGPRLLNEPEAKAFKAAWEGFGPSKMGLDYPDRAEAAWAAVRGLRP